MTDVLESIVQKTRERLHEQKKRITQSDLEKEIAGQKRPKGFAQALRRTAGVSVIAELKQASPSAGVIREESNLSLRLQGYVKGGAAALSILTEEYFFHGSPRILEMARKETDLPILRKDFMIEPYQLIESLHMGADAILLITTLLDPTLLKEMVDYSREIGIDALVEIHTVRDLDKALKSGAAMIGVNHRDLRTLQMDLTLSQSLLPLIPLEKTRIVESGIKQPEELSRFRDLGAHAALVGETLMRDPNPEAIVRSFVEAGSGEKGHSR